MNPMISQPKWKVVEYSRSQIINAGSIIRGDGSTDDQITEATRVIDNWRAAHAFPLHVIYIHLRGMAKDKSSVIVAERLKRLDSIVNKLKREKNMNLWTMQDLGGCRVIVPTVEDVYAFSEKYESSRKRHMLKKHMIILKILKSQDIEAYTGYTSITATKMKHITKICSLRFSLELTCNIYGQRQ